jgi:hypothetical protein
MISRKNNIDKEVVMEVLIISFSSTTAEYLQHYQCMVVKISEEQDYYQSAVSYYSDRHSRSASSDDSTRTINPKTIKLTTIL